MARTSLLPLLLLLAAAAVALTEAAAGTLSPLVKGRPTGFAKDTIGGGNVAPSYPKDIHELTALLKDPAPRVIVINKVFDFRGSEGRKTELGCRPKPECGVDKGGQDAINPSFGWCSSAYPKVQVTYDVAGTRGLTVAGSKTIVGQGNAAEIRGKGLRILGTNVIVQNIKIRDLNPQYIWGGDALAIARGDLVWIDHNTISEIGRQFIVTGYDPAGRVTISNNELDGRTKWSATCNGRHYWTMLLLGGKDRITLQGNYIHHTSGRGPKVGGTESTIDVVVHAVNNVWSDVDGEAFGVHGKSVVLAEGNYLQNVKRPRTSDTEGTLLVAETNAAQCKAGGIDRVCQANKLVGSGALTPAGPKKLTTATINGSFPASYDAPFAYSADAAFRGVICNAGAGKL
ncbi:hypothetical protein H9P43_006501 [Blastocladiella emersonii ATCC 22665]|nr:hypothetical protein H9P43_006501 [Blastocladiella emersonii ATCC 22665]